MLEHVREAALAGGIVDVAGIDKGGVTEDRRLVTLANNESEPVGKHLNSGALLKTLQILAVGAAARGNGHNHPEKARPKPGK